MTVTAKMIAAIPLVLLSFAISGAQSSGAELDLGVAAYKNARYEEAIRHFQRAIEVDPGNLKAHLYLATTYTGQYIPGIDTPENVQLAQQAIDQYQFLLDSDPNQQVKLNSVKNIAYLHLNMMKFDDAKKYNHMASDLDGNDPEPHYSVGVVDWTECYQPRMQARARLGLRPDDRLDAKDPDQKKVCDDLRARNIPLIEEGMDNLMRAIELRPDYDDAMASLNLLYRERADLQCDDPEARAEDLKTADEWVDKTLATKKAKTQRTVPSEATSR